MIFSPLFIQIFSFLHTFLETTTNFKCLKIDALKLIIFIFAMEKNHSEGHLTLVY